MVEGTEHGEDREGEEGEACGILHFTKNSRPYEKRKKNLKQLWIWTVLLPMLFLI